MPESRDKRGGLSLQTLVIASLASATAAMVVSQFWKGGTIMSAAITPVIVAIVSELLHRPAKQVTKLSSVTRERGRAAPSARRSREPSTAGLERLGGEVSSAPRGAPPPPRGPREGGMRVYSPPAPRRRLHIRLALITGLLAFVIAALVLTVPELISGSSTLGDGKTTLFGGDRGEQTEEQDTETQPEDEQPAETTTPTEPEQPDDEAAPEQTQPQTPPPTQTQPAPQPTPPPQSQPAP